MTPLIASRWTVHKMSPARVPRSQRAHAAACSGDRTKLAQRAMQSCFSFWEKNASFRG